LKVGLAINPPTAISNVVPFSMKSISLLIMRQPGFGGPAVHFKMIPKVQQAFSWRKEKQLAYHIEVDGGITNATAAECARAGADVFVSGTALFGQRHSVARTKNARPRPQRSR